MGIFADNLWTVQQGGGEAKERDVGRILSEHRLSPEVCDSASERAAPGKRESRRRERRPRYGAQTLSILAAIWEAAGYPWSVRLKAILPNWMPWIRQRYRRARRRRGSCWASVRGKWTGGWGEKRRKCKQRLYGQTKPGTLLKHHIPVKTDSWSVTTPGFAEIDLVSHSGNSGEGEFAYTLNLTDIHTGWTESRALLGKGQVAVRQALEEIQKAFALRPFGSGFGQRIGVHQLASAGVVQTEKDPTDAGTAVQEGR